MLIMLISHKETPTPCFVSIIAARTIIKNPSKIMDNFAKQCKFLKVSTPLNCCKKLQVPKTPIHPAPYPQCTATQTQKQPILQEQRSKIFCQEESPRNSFGHYSVPICTTTIKNPSKRTCPRYVKNAMLRKSNTSFKPGSSITSFNISKFPEEMNPPQSLPRNRGHDPPTKTPTLQLGLASVVSGTVLHQRLTKRNKTQTK
jgi:hypothetical protein